MNKFKLRIEVIIFVIAVLVAIALAYRTLSKNSQLNDIKNKLTNSSTDSVTTESKFKAILKKNFESQEKQLAEEKLNSPLVIQERFYTEQEIKEMTEEEFTNLLKATELKLPLITDIKKLPAQALHRTPEPIIQAGRDLGLIKEILSIHQSYEKSALPFYENCSNKVETPNTVRAMCLTNLIELKKNSGEKINLKKYPVEITRLVEMITDL